MVGQAKTSIELRYDTASGDYVNDVHLPSKVFFTSIFSHLFISVWEKYAFKLFSDPGGIQTLAIQ